MDKSFDLVTFMKNHEKKHKKKPSQFMSVAGGVQKRLEKNIKYRKSSRLSVFDSIRNLPSCEVPEPISENEKKVEHRRMQLEKWKEEKEKKKKDAAAQKKKPFVAGIAHPPLKYVPPPPPKPLPSTSGRVTRSQSSKTNAPPVKNIQVKNAKATKSAKNPQSFAPSNASFKPPEFKNASQLPTLTSLPKIKKKKTDITFDPVVPSKDKQASKLKTQSKPSSSKTNSHSKSKSEKPVKSKATKLSLTKDSSSSSASTDTESVSSKINNNKNKTPKKNKKQESILVTPENTIPKSESSSEERLRSPVSSSFEERLVPHRLSNTPKTPDQLIDPKNISPCVTMSRGKDNARKEMKKKMEEGLLDDDNSNIDSVDFFRCQLDSEVKRISELCDTWDKISQQVPLNETAMEMLLGAVGQGRLLVSQKLAQFGSLVESCARPEPGAALVTPADLHGFWDMVFMQVENVDMRFKKLEDLRSRNWVEEQPIVHKRKAPKVVKNTTKPAATSRLRDLIAAARKAKKVQEPIEAGTEENSKTFEAGFFCVRSPVKSSPLPSTPTNKGNLLKAVLSSEAKKASASKNSASLAMLRASFIGKNMDNGEMNAFEKTPKSQINLTATPARSILKSTNIASTKRKSGKKSIKVVLFSDSDVESQAKEDSFVGNEEECVKIAEATDSGLSSMDIDKEGDKEDKENVKRKSKLIRQNALDDRSPVLTRSRRKSLNTPLLDVTENQEDRRKSKAKNDAEDRTNQTPKRSSRRKKNSIIDLNVA